MMELVTFKLPKQLIQKLDELIEKGLFVNRSEALREAVRLLLDHYGEKNDRQS